MLVVRPLYIQRLDDAAFVLLAFMQFSRQHFWLCSEARSRLRQAVHPCVCNKRSKAQPIVGNMWHELLLDQQPNNIVGYQSLRQRSLHRADTLAIPVGVRRIVTRATNAPDLAFGENGLWQWRKAQLYKIAMFTGPALSIPLADPIMSLVDTVCIGQVPKEIAVILMALTSLRNFCLISVPGLQYTGTLELAALGPTMLIFNLFTYVFTAITITTVRCYYFGTDAAAVSILYCILASFCFVAA